MSHGYGRAPWETLEQEAREDGYYSRGARGDSGVRYYSRGGQQIDPTAADRRDEQLRQQRRTREYCYGGTERIQRHDHDDSMDAFHEYCPPPQYSSAPSDPYFNDRPGYQGWHARRAGDDFAYGVGFPPVGDGQRSRRDASSPPLAITTDNSSNASQRYVGGSLDDAYEGYALLRRRTQSLDDDAFDGYAPVRRRTQSLDDASDGYAPRRRTGSPALSCIDGSAGANAGADASPSAKRTMIEIAPGVKMLLRGARETWNAYRRKFYVSVTCVGCSTKIFCIQDADCVLCPVCRMVNPLLEAPKPSSYGRRIGGLGLGFTGKGDLCRQREGMKIAQLSKPT